MKTFILVTLVSLSLVAQASTSHTDQKSQETVSAKKSKGRGEPAPKDDDRQGGGDGVDPRQENYEGNDRDGGGSFDGGGYEGDDGGFGSELFFVNTKVKPTTTTSTTEDRGDFVIYTTRVHEDVAADETCTTVTIVTVAKSNGKTISTNSDYYCNRWPL